MGGAAIGPTHNSGIAGPELGYIFLGLIILILIILYFAFKYNQKVVSKFKIPNPVQSNGVLVPFMRIATNDFSNADLFVKLIIFEDYLEYCSTTKKFVIKYKDIKNINYGREFPGVIPRINIDNLLHIDLGQKDASHELLSFFQRKNLPLSKSAKEFLKSFN